MGRRRMVVTLDETHDDLYRRSPNGLIMRYFICASAVTGAEFLEYAPPPHESLMTPPHWHESSRNVSVSGAFGSEIKIKLGAICDRGAMSDVYPGILTDVRRGINNLPCIGKLVVPAYFGDPGWTMTPQEATEAVIAEFELFNGPLYELQGSVVPKCFGLFVGQLFPTLGVNPKNNLMIALIEDVGSSVLPIGAPDDDLAQLPENDKIDIIQLYKRLHSVNVCHGDFSARHIRRRTNGQLSLIDFERSKVLGSDSLTREMREVELTLWPQTSIGRTTMRF
ncbi:hypothetical protein BCR39DRAFT_342343 [Naematelia encephala]|uniref:Protein kinase domain-containing protein n=1 Tax=Naematelia encephala TaxID=71784 RepID=A0A1Y2ANK8_9TREE|nr:hypothetical protein BCR39DRAFT_342343 [Naematelia encephala]